MILVNGQPGDTLPVQDRGLAYGDGLFETLAVRDGKPLHWDRHMARLAGAARAWACPRRMPVCGWPRRTGCWPAAGSGP